MEGKIEKHGGQDIYDDFDALIDDFSVTTNYLGPNEAALHHIQEHMHLINHYPKDDKQPYTNNLIEFLYKDLEHTCPYLILGNGASELIDLVCRISCMIHPEYATYYVKETQYKEYERSLKLQNLSYIENIQSADIVSIVNPCNPTGEYLSIQDIKKVINSCKNNATILVDESMQLWQGSDFRKDSLLSQQLFINDLCIEKNIKIFIIHSYTKFYSCTGIRIGSIICPNEETYNKILHYQNPWSNNIMALEYLDKCLIDEVYAHKTWDTTQMLRTYQSEKINEYFPNWKVYGESWLSWMWIELSTEQEAFEIYEISKQHHMPIRWGKMGYNKPTFIRVAVRETENFHKLLQVWIDYIRHKETKKQENINNDINNINDKKYPILYKFYNNTVIHNKVVSLDSLKFHEEFSKEKFTKLYNYYKTLGENVRIIPTIIIDVHTNVIIDGHHRYQLFKKMGLKEVEVTCIDYMHCDNIIVNPFNAHISKQDVINIGLSKDVWQPKTTQHMIQVGQSLQPIIYLSTNILVFNE